MSQTDMSGPQEQTIPVNYQFTYTYTGMGIENPNSPITIDAVPSMDGVVGVGEYDYSATLDAATGFVINYTITPSTVYMAMQADVTGWIAVGFESPDVTLMTDADIIMGANDGTHLISEEYGTGGTSHDTDTNLGGTYDITDSASSDDGTTTIVEFTRPRNTGDTYDKTITTGSPSDVIWAFHPTLDDFTKKHSNTDRGGATVTFTESAESTTPPTAPQSLSATGGDSTVGLSWSVPADDGGDASITYNVYRATGTGGPYSSLGSTASTTYSDNTAVNGNTYYYVVNATNSAGTGPNSNEASAPAGTAPSTPQTLAVTNSGDSFVYMTWSAPVDDGGWAISQYTVKRSTTQGSGYTNQGTTSDLFYNDTTVTNGVTYYYVVSATNAIDESLNSNEASSTPSTIPNAPGTLSAIGSDSSVSLSWSAPGDDGGSSITTYTVYRSITSGSGYTVLTTTASTSYTDNSATNGQEYFYVVTANNTNGESLYSNEASATPATVPTAPQSLSVTDTGNGYIYMTWSTPADDGGAAIIQYKVYRSTTSGSGYTLQGTTGDLFFNNTGISNGQTYYYVIRATNTEGDSPNSNEASGFASTVPTAPLSLSASKGNGFIDLTWSVPSSDGGSAIIKYRVFRSTTSGSGYTNIGNTTLTTYNDTTALNGQTYYYVVTAFNGNGDSPYSNEPSATPSTLSTAPQSLSVSNTGDGFAYLTWSVPADDGGATITSYTVYRSTSSGSGYTPQGSTGDLFFNDTGITNGQTYYYVVTASNSNGESVYSNEASATPSTVPTAPGSLSASKGDGFVYMTWSQPADGGSAITTYTVYRSTTSGSGYGSLGNTNDLFFNDTTAVNGQIYYFVVTASNANGESLYSNEVSATPSTLSTAPQSLSVSNTGDDFVYLTWSAPADDGGATITSYTIYRSTTSGSGYTLQGTTGDLFFNNTGTTNGQTYYYVVTASNSNGESVYSNEASGTSSTVPTAPGSLSASKGDGFVYMTWSQPADGGSAITTYTVYRSTTSGSGYSSLGSTSNLYFNDTTAVNGQIYYFVVTASNVNGESLYSNEVSATPSTVSTAPQSLTATKGNGFVELSWSIPADDGGATITQYKVYRGLSSGTHSYLGSSASTTYNDTTAENGQTYYYVVKATNANGDSPNSNEVTSTPSTVSSAPQSLTVSNSGDNFVYLTWSIPADDGGASIIQYNVYRSTSSGTGYSSLGSTTDLFYNDTTTVDGTTYYYIVRAENTNGESPASNEVSGVSSSEPSVPQNLTISSSDSQVVLNWTAPADNGGYAVTQYRVYRSTGGAYTFIGSSATLSYVDSPVTNGITYYYKVSALNSVGEGSQTTEVSTTPSTIPTAPQSLAATASDQQVSLTWSAPSSSGGASLLNYTIYRSTTSGSGHVFVDNTTDTSYIDTGLTNGQTYYYLVTAWNIRGESSASNEASDTPATVPTVPQSVNVVSADNQVNLDWTAPADNGGLSITQYNIYRSTTSGSGYSIIGDSTLLYYNDTTAVNGQTYYYVITAVNAVGESAYSSEVTGNPIGVPSVPLSVTATAGDNNVTLSWSAPSNDGGSAIIEYSIYRSTTSGSGYVFIANSSITSYLDTSALNGQTYYYIITAWNIQGESNASSEKLVTLANVPDAPQTPSATTSDQQVTLSWVAPADVGGSPLVNYTIYRASVSGGPYSFVGNTTSLTFTDTGLTNGQSYYYVITAVNSDGQSPYSEEVAAIPATVPNSPGSVGSTSSNGEVTITWSAPLDGGSAILNYTIYQSSTSGSGYVAIANTTNLSFTVTGLTNGDPYYFVVSAWNIKGESLDSTETSATPSTIPSQPLDLVAVASNGQISLSWTAPTDDGGATITSYTVYRSTSSGSGYSSIGSTGTTSFVDTTAVNGVVYYYVVVADNLRGESPYSSEVSEFAGETASAPQNLTATYGDSSVSLSWDTPADNGGLTISEYHIYRATSIDGTYTQVGTSLSTSFTNTGLTNGMTYYYLVNAVNQKGEGDNSSIVSQTPSTIPTAPTSLSISRGDNQLSLSWSVPSSDGGATLQNYSIYRGTSSGGPYNFVANTTDTAYIDTGLVDGTTYYYIVRAVNFNGESTNSNQASMKPGSVPSTPTSPSATSGDNEVTLSWSAPTDNGGFSISLYTVYQSTSSGTGYVKVTDTSLSTYTVTGLTDGIPYYFVITANNSLGESLESSEVTATPGSVPGTPTSVAASATDQQISLTWNAPSDNGGFAISDYSVYRSTTSGSGYVFVTNTSSTSFIDTGLTNGVTYYYVITAWNVLGESSNSLEVNGTPETVASAPQNVNAEQGDNQVTLTWSAPTDDGGSSILQYKIYQSLTSGGPWSLIKTTDNATIYPFTVTGLTDGSTYYFYITAITGVGEGTASSEVSATPGSVSSAPQSPSVSAGNLALTLSWSAPADLGGFSILNYTIYRSLTSGSGFTFLVNTTDTSYIDTGLTYGETYYYYITATNARGESSTSSEVNGTPKSVPTAPQNVNAEQGDNQVVLTWEAPADNGGSNILQYRIYQSSSSGGPWGLIFSPGPSTFTYTVTGLTDGGTYYFYIIATTTVGDGVASSEVSATPGSVSSAPQSPSVSQGNLELTISWSAPADLGGFSILNYTIYRSLTSGSGFTFLVNTTDTSYVDTGLTNGETYYYYITATNARGESSATIEVNAAPGSVPTAPQNVSATGGNLQVVLTWEAPADDGGFGVSGYNIYNSTTSGSGYQFTGFTTSLTFTHDPLPNGVTYYYVITALNSQGESLYSIEVMVSTGIAPSAPQNVVVSVSNNTVDISWDAPSQDGGHAVTDYNVYRANSSGIYELIVTVPSTYYNDTDVINGETYTYRISAINTKGEGTNSTAKPAQPGTVPSAPFDLVVVDESQQMVLTWSAPYDGGFEISSYKIYKNYGTGFVFLISVTNLNYTDTDVIQGVTYIYKVSAVNSFGESSNSPEVIGKPGDVPNAPGNVQIDWSSTSLSLTWDAAVENGYTITEYRIYKTTVNDGNWIFLTSTTSLNFEDSDVVNATTYYYVITAVNSKGESAYSSIVSSAPRSVPDAPFDLTGEASNTAIFLEWQEPAGNGGYEITSYIIYRSNGQVNATVGTSTTASFTDTNALFNSTEYTYWVSAVNTVGESEISNEFTILYEFFIEDTDDTTDTSSDTSTEDTLPADPELQIPPGLMFIGIGLLLGALASGRRK